MGRTARRRKLAVLLACAACVAFPGPTRADVSLVTQFTVGGAFDPARAIRPDSDSALQYGAHVRTLFGPLAKEHETTFRLGPFAQYAAVAETRHSFSFGASYLLTGYERGGSTLGQILPLTLPLTASAGVSRLSLKGERARWGPRLRLDWGLAWPTDDIPSGPLAALFVDAGYFPSKSSGTRADIAIGLALDPLAIVDALSHAPDLGELARFR